MTPIRRWPGPSCHSPTAGKGRTHAAPGNASLPLQADDAALESDGDGGSAVVDVELVEDVDQVRLHRGLANGEARRDLLVRCTLRDQAQDIDLTWGERLLPWLVQPCHEAGGDRRGEERLARRRGADGAEEVLARGVLQQVAGGS